MHKARSNVHRDGAEEVQISEIKKNGRTNAPYGYSGSITEGSIGFCNANVCP